MIEFLADVIVAAFESGKRRTRDHGDRVAVEAIARQQLADFQFNELEDFCVVDLVNLVHVHDQRRNADLASEQDVLAGLRHRAVGSVHHQNRAVHLRRTGDHVLHIVGVARAIDVRIVARSSFILDVSGRDGDATLALFGSLVDVRKINSYAAVDFSHDLGDCGRQRGLAVVNVTDGANVAVRLVPLEFSLSHCLKPSFALM